MELSRINTNHILKGIEKKIFFFCISFLISQIPFLNNSYIFTIPLLSIAFLSGYSFIFAYFLAIVLSVVFFNVSLTLLFLSVIIIGVLEIFSYIYAMKSTYIPLILSLSVCLALLYDYLYFENYTIPMVIVASAITYGLTQLYLNSASFFIHLDFEKTTYYHLLVIAMMLVSSSLVIGSYQTTIMFLIIRFLILAVAYIIGFDKGYQLVLFSSFTLLLNNLSYRDPVICLMIPLASFYALRPKTKTTYFLFYVIVHTIIPFFHNEELINYVIQVLGSAIIFYLIPNHVYLNIKRITSSQEIPIVNQIGGVISYQRKIARKLEEFSELFNRIAFSFKESAIQPNVLTYIGNVYDDVCSSCVNKEQCFHRKKDVNRLVKLIKKGVITSLNKEESNYIDRYCINSRQYKQALSQQCKLYKHQNEMNEEYHFLKKNLYNQLTLVGDVLNNFSSHVGFIDVYSEESIKEVLEGYHFKIPYIFKDEVSKDEYTFDIGIMETTKQEVFDVVIPVLEKTLDTKLNLIDMKSTANRMGYTSIKLSNKQSYQLVYGVQQISKDEDFCGDNYIFFRYNQFSLIALSDGMGYGKKAHEESKLTLDVFSKLLKSGIDLEDSIQTINSLLKIKNRIEMFTTIDLLMFDSNDASITFLKNGAMPSYVYHYNHLEKVQTKSLPIGIVSKIDTTREMYQCSDGDLVIMFSDGFEESIEEIVDSVLEKNYLDHPQKIADVIMNTLAIQHKIDDDATIIVARVEDVNLHRKKRLTIEH